MNFRAIGVGDFAPNSVFADQDGQPVSLVEIPYAGAFTAVAVLRDTGNPNAAAFLGALKAQAAQFEAAGTLLVAVLAMPAAELASLGNSLQPGFAMLGDANGECAASFGLMESAGAGMIAILAGFVAADAGAVVRLGLILKNFFNPGHHAHVETG